MNTPIPCKKEKFFCRKNMVGYLLLLPELVVFSAFLIYPIIRNIVLSFYEFNVQQSTFIGWDNYISIFKDPLFAKAFLNTALYTLLTLPAGILLALIVASLLNPLSARWQSFFKAAYYLPGVLSGVVVAITWKWIMDPNNGILNAVLANFGIEGIKWLSHPSTAMLSLALIAVMGGQGQSIVVLLANMGSISPAIYESAKIDGAGPVATFVRITVPLLKPTILYLTVTGLISSFVIFENIYLITGGGPASSTTTIAYLIYQEAFSFFDFGRSSAMSTVLFVVIMLMALLQFKLMGEKKDEA